MEWANKDSAEQDLVSEIRKHCESLELQVTSAFEKNIKYLKLLHENNESQINQYQQKLIDEILANYDEHQADLAQLSIQINSLDQIVFNFYQNGAKEEEIDKLKREITECENIFNEKEKKIEGKQFYARRLEFDGSSETNSNLCEYDPIGKFYYSPQNPVLKVENASCTITGHTECIRQIKFLPNGQLASCSDDSTIKIWNLEPGTLSYEFKCPEPILSLAALPKNRLTSGSNDGSITIWSLKKRKIIMTLDEHTKGVFSLAVLRNGNLASCSYDDTIKIWDLRSKTQKRLLHSMYHDIWYGSNQLSFLPNGYMITCSTGFRFDHEDAFIQIRHPRNGKVLDSVDTYLYKATCICVLNNGDVAVAFEHCEIIVFDIFTKKQTCKMPDKFSEDLISSMVQIPNNDDLLCVSRSKSRCIQIWDIEEETLIDVKYTDHIGKIQFLIVSQDGRSVVTCSNDKTIKIWPLSIRSKQVGI